MRKCLLLVAAALCLGMNCSCGKNTVNDTQSVQETTAAQVLDNTNIDVDLTQMSNTMIYSTVSNMMLNPNVYDRQKIKIRGTYRPFHDETTGKNYNILIIPDATACCEQGMEFSLAGEHKFPDDYPNEGQYITVTGIFSSYKEDGLTYVELSDASMVVDQV